MYSEGGDVLEQIAQEVLPAPYLEVFKTKLDGAWHNMV